MKNYWQTARVTTDSGEGHCTVGICPACGGLGSQRDAVRTSSGEPPLKPLARQPVAAAEAQSEPPFGARAQTSLAWITRACSAAARWRLRRSWSLRPRLSSHPSRSMPRLWWPSTALDAAPFGGLDRVLHRILRAVVNGARGRFALPCRRRLGCCPPAFCLHRLPGAARGSYLFRSNTASRSSHQVLS